MGYWKQYDKIELEFFVLGATSKVNHVVRAEIARQFLGNVEASHANAANMVSRVIAFCNDFVNFKNNNFRQADSLANCVYLFSKYACEDPMAIVDRHMYEQAAAWSRDNENLLTNTQESGTEAQKQKLRQGPAVTEDQSHKYDLQPVRDEFAAWNEIMRE